MINDDKIQPNTTTHLQRIPSLKNSYPRFRSSVSTAPSDNADVTEAVPVHIDWVFNHIL